MRDVMAAAIAIALLGALLWWSRCRHQDERFTRDEDTKRRTFTCNRCGRVRVSQV